MTNKADRYSLESVKQDVKSFFQDCSHWAYRYGSKATSCNNDSVFYKKQIQVIFEDRYPHDITGKAVNELISDRFLRSDERPYGKGMRTIFVRRRDLRYKAKEMKLRLEVMSAFSDDEMNDGCGKYAEILFLHMFEKNHFDILARDASTFKKRRWTKSDRNLDFIVRKDAVAYGVEIKNTFDYMEPDEFADKLEMCHHLGLIPLFPLRCPSESQFRAMKGANGLALKFKARIFPPGNQKLVTQIWNTFRLPITIWETIPPTIEKQLLTFHQRQATNR